MRKTALVTGGAGFIGRHMADELERRGYDVVTVDLRPTSIVSMLGHTSRVHIIQDVHDFIARTSVTYDLVVHCAYHVGGRAMIDGTNLNFMENVRLDSALLNWATRTDQGHVLYFSSSAVYPTVLQRKDAAHMLQEYDQIPRGAHYVPDCDSWYGWAKYVGECLVDNARHNGLKVTVVRPFSGYGSDQSLDYPFPSFIKRVSEGLDPMPMWGDPTQARDWIHVSDVVRGALAVVDYEVEVPVNLGTGYNTSMTELINLMWAQRWPDRDLPRIVPDLTKPQGVHTRVCDPSLFFSMYEPKVTLLEGVRQALGDYVGD